MQIDLPANLEAALMAQANAKGVSPSGYVCQVLQHDLAPALESSPSSIPFKIGHGTFAKYGHAPSAEEIDANRADMSRNFVQNPR